MKRSLVFICLLLFTITSNGFAATLPTFSGTSVPTDGTVLFNFQIPDPDLELVSVDTTSAPEFLLPADSILTDLIQITSATAISSTAAVPWLDGPAFGGKPAGLGVCQEPGGCAGLSTDNIEAGESVLLEISNASSLTVLVGDLYFRNGLHEVDSFTSGTEIDITIDGITMFTIAATDLDADGKYIGTFADALFNTVITSSIEFSNPGAVSGGENSDFYVSGFGAAVPVPAAVWLFGSALAGFVGFTRRRDFNC